MEGILATLKSLPPEVVSKNGGVVRQALRKGAMVIVRQARTNFNAAVAEPGKTGVTISTGFTEKNIMAIRKKPPPGESGERFIVSVSTKTHPNNQKLRRKARRTKNSTRARVRMLRELRANDVAYMMEWGTSQQPATPWLRPAFKAKAQEAINVASSDLVRRVELIVKRLAAQNRSK